MARLKKLSNRLVVLIVFVLSFTRVMVARILPWVQPPEKPAAPKVFTLSDEEWMQLRAVNQTATGQQTPPAADEKKTTTPDTAKKDDAAKDTEKGQKPDCKPKTADSQNTQKDKDKNAAKDCDEGPGGGDGDLGGTGG